MSQFYKYPPISITATNPSVGLNGTTAPTSSTEVGGIGVDGNLHPLSTDNSGVLNVNVVSPAAITNYALETGGHLQSVDTKLTSQATAALQTTGNASLASIDSKLTAPLAVTGPLTDVQLRASAVPVSLASSPLPAGAATEATLAAFSAKSAGALVPEAFDYQEISYVGASTDIDTVLFKSGGAAGTLVATLTMAYDGSNRLSSVTKT